MVGQDDSATRKKKIKSETRRRNKLASVRLTDAEDELLEGRSRDAGLSKAAYLRKKALGTPGVRAKKRPLADEEELAKILAQLGKIGSNVNQLAKQANTDGFNSVRIDILSPVLEDVSAMKAVLMKALKVKDI